MFSSSIFVKNSQFSQLLVDLLGIDSQYKQKALGYI